MPTFLSQGNLSQRNTTFWIEEIAIKVSHTPARHLIQEKNFSFNKKPPYSDFFNRQQIETEPFFFVKANNVTIVLLPRGQ